MTVMTLKPAPGRAVRDPVTGKPLAAAGEAKELDAFWHRRIKAGDVVEVAPVKADKHPNDRFRITAFSDGTGEMEVIPASEVAGTPSGIGEEPLGAESPKTNSRRARRAAKAED